jgi:hypothetical protein
MQEHIKNFEQFVNEARNYTKFTTAEEASLNTLGFTEANDNIWRNDTISVWKKEKYYFISDEGERVPKPEDFASWEEFESELTNLVSEGLNEKLSDIETAIEIMKSADGGMWEAFLGWATKHYINNTDDLTNMDAKGISKDLQRGRLKIRNRTSD